MLIENTIKPIGKCIENRSFVMIRVPNKLAAKSLSDHLHSKGYKWKTGETLQNNSKWDKYKENTVYIISNILKKAYISNVVQNIGVIYAKRKL